MLRYATLFALAACVLSDSPPPTVPPSEFTCPSGLAVEHSYPSSTDCGVYYRCIPGYPNAYKYECTTSNQVFYEPDQQCLYDYDVPPPCGNLIGSTSAPATGGPAETTSCVGLPIGRHPVQNCCTKFFDCTGEETGIVLECSNGLAYNPATEQCDYASNVSGCADLHCN